MSIPSTLGTFETQVKELMKYMKNLASIAPDPRIKDTDPIHPNQIHQRLKYFELLVKQLQGEYDSLSKAKGEMDEVEKAQEEMVAKSSALDEGLAHLTMREEVMTQKQQDLESGQKALANDQSRFRDHMIPDFVASFQHKLNPALQAHEEQKKQLEGELTEMKEQLETAAKKQEELVEERAQHLQTIETLRKEPAAESSRRKRRFSKVPSANDVELEWRNRVNKLADFLFIHRPVSDDMEDTKLVQLLVPACYDDKAQEFLSNFADADAKDWYCYDTVIQGGHQSTAARIRPQGCLQHPDDREPCYQVQNGEKQYGRGSLVFRSK